MSVAGSTRAKLFLEGREVGRVTSVVEPAVISSALHVPLSLGSDGPGSVGPALVDCVTCQSDLSALAIP